MNRKEIAGVSRRRQSRISGAVRMLAILACLSISTSAYCQVKIADSRTLPRQTRSVLASIKAGLTRADVERECTMDGGLQGISYSERYIVPGYHDGRNVVMVDIQFKPVGVPEDVYKDPQRFKDWCTVHLKPSRESGTDIVVSVSPPYLDSMSYD